jgi:hypothetical protein
MRRILAGFLLAAAPITAPAFEAVDTLPYPSLGTFPAYPPEAIRPGRLFAQVGVMRDDNVLRRARNPQSETISRLGLGAAYDARVYGRQVVRLEATGDLYSYDRFSELDHFAYGVLGEWGWELGNELSGTLGYGRRRFQADLAERQSAVEDIVTAQRLYGSAAYRFSPDWRLRAAADAAHLGRPDAVTGDTRSNSLTAGIDYVTPLGNTLGVEGRTASGDAPLDLTIDPAGQFRDNEYDESSIAAVAAYNLGPQLRLGARVAQTERTYTLVPSFDFEGTTYRFDAAWRPGNKTLLGFEVYKAPRSVIDIGATQVIARGVAFGPSWAPTAKLVFAARILREEREYPGDPGALGLVDIRKEVVRGLRVAAGWEATRRFHFGVAWDTGERRSNVLDRDYDYNAVMANARFVF